MGNSIDERSFNGLLMLLLVCVVGFDGLDILLPGFLLVYICVIADLLLGCLGLLVLFAEVLA